MTSFAFEREGYFLFGTWYYYYYWFKAYCWCNFTVGGDIDLPRAPFVDWFESGLVTMKGALVDVPTGAQLLQPTHLHSLVHGTPNWKHSQ